MCRASRSGSQSLIAAPSIRTTPLLGWAEPARTLSSVDLPAPLGPITPMKRPASICRLTFCSATRSRVGVITLTVSSVTSPAGSGRRMWASSGLARANSLFRLSNAPWAWMMLFHEPTICSMGASARVKSSEAAITEPAEICRSMASHAPTPSAADCSTRRAKRIRPL